MTQKISPRKGWVYLFGLEIISEGAAPEALSPKYLNSFAAMGVTHLAIEFPSQMYSLYGRKNNSLLTVQSKEDPKVVFCTNLLEIGHL
jgi:hypothetical protein